MSKQADNQDVDWTPEDEKTWEKFPPPINREGLPPMQPNLDVQLNQGGITRMIVPTIMQCSCGGFLVTVPGVGTYAASTLEEIMGFVEAKTMDHFKAKKSEFPRVLRDKVRDTTDSLVDSVAGLRKRVDGSMAMIVLGGLLLGWTIFGGWNNEGQEKHLGAAKAANGSSIRGDLRRSGDARESGAPLLPEIQLLKVRPAPNDGDAKRLSQDGLLRPVWPHN